jgi:hypothetical protein
VETGFPSGTATGEQMRFQEVEALFLSDNSKKQDRQIRGDDDLARGGAIRVEPFAAGATCCLGGSESGVPAR